MSLGHSLFGLLVYCSLALNPSQGIGGLVQTTEQVVVWLAGLLTLVWVGFC